MLGNIKTIQLHPESKITRLLDKETPKNLFVRRYIPRYHFNGIETRFTFTNKYLVNVNTFIYVILIKYLLILVPFMLMVVYTYLPTSGKSY